MAHQLGTMKEAHGMAQSRAPETGTKDVTYDLVSILYHALQGAEIYGKYMEDAEKEGASEIRQFFQEICDEERRRAERVKGILIKHLEKEATH